MTAMVTLNTSMPTELHWWHITNCCHISLSEQPNYCTIPEIYV